MIQLKLTELNLASTDILDRRQIAVIFGGTIEEVEVDSGECTYRTCQCYEFPGTWTGCYSSGSQLHQDILDYCPNYAYCD